MIRAFLLLLLLPTICFGDEVADLIDGALARSTAIKSGRLVYDLDFHDGEYTGAGGKDPTLYRYFSWSGDSWAEGGGGTGGTINNFGYPVRAYHDGCLIEGFDNYRLSQMRPDHDAPSWAGSFNLKGEVQAFREYKNRFKAIPDQTIAGVLSKGIEINCNDFDRKQHRHLVGRGTMRFYIAPLMGYVITGREAIGADGEIYHSEWNSDWHEVASGIFMPFKIYRRWGKGTPGTFESVEKAHIKRADIPAGETESEKRERVKREYIARGMFESDKEAIARNQRTFSREGFQKLLGERIGNDYVIISATQINQPLPGSDFRARVKAGMVIEDLRDPAHPIQVTTTEASSSDKWEKLLTEERLKKKPANPSVAEEHQP